MSEDKQYSAFKVIKVLTERFDEQEMIIFCDYLREKVDPEIDYENFPGQGKRNKIRELVGFIQRRNKMSEFIAALNEHRPDIDITKLEVVPPKPTLSPPPPVLDWNHWRSWWRWCVIVPLIVILAIWIYEKPIDANNAYAISFAHGDLLLFSALLLFGVSVQLKTFEGERSHLVNIKTLNFFKRFARVGAVLLLLFFNFMKHCMSRNRCLAFTPSLEVLNTYSGFTLSITTASIAFGYYAYWKMKKQRADAKT